MARKSRRSRRCWPHTQQNDVGQNKIRELSIVTVFGTLGGQKRAGKAEILPNKRLVDRVAVEKAPLIGGGSRDDLFGCQPWPLDIPG